MARFSIAFRKTKATGIGGFHADYIDNHNRRPQRKSMGLGRTIFSGLSLILGAVMFYVTLHYVPALINPQKVLGYSSPSKAASELKAKNPVQKIITPYIDAFRSKRTYLRAGQTIQAQYTLPKGAILDLQIHQCKRMWIVEVFTCSVVSQNNHTVKNDVLGTQAFTFPDTGFYYFDDVVTLPEGDKDYRVVWSRKS